MLRNTLLNHRPPFERRVLLIGQAAYEVFGEGLRDMGLKVESHPSLPRVWLVS